MAFSYSFLTSLSSRTKRTSLAKQACYVTNLPSLVKRSCEMSNVIHREIKMPQEDWSASGKEGISKHSHIITVSLTSQTISGKRSANGQQKRRSSHSHSIHSFHSVMQPCRTKGSRNKVVCPVILHHDHDCSVIQ